MNWILVRTRVNLGQLVTREYQVYSCTYIHAYVYAYVMPMSIQRETHVGT